MSRYRDYTPRDEQAQPDGDTAFTGLNLKLDPSALPPGTLSESVNKRLRRGVAETRPGLATPAHFNALEWGALYGSGVYREIAADGEWLLLATALGVYRAADGHYPEQILLPPGEAVSGPCEFVQLQDRVLLLRGADEEPLEWDGRLQSRFKFIDMTSSGTGIEPIPNAATAELFANRLIVPFNRDELAVSDILDFTRYDSALAQFKINSGTNETLVRVLPFARTTILLFKSRSIFSLENFFGNLGSLQLVTISNNIGACARRSVVMVGADALFLSASPAGVYRVQQVVQERLQTSPVPVSDPIEPLIARINWSAAANACAVLFEEYYLLAVPLDGATVNNAVLVLNTITGAWESLDTFPNVTTGTPDLAQHDFAVIRYLWDVGNGTDLDTRTAIINLDGGEPHPVVTGAGTAVVNGEYRIAGTLFGKPYYSNGVHFLYWTGTQWSCGNSSEYFSAEDTAFPWEVTSWTVSTGLAPAPSVAEAAVNGDDVGWARGDTVSGPGGAYLSWASDNTDTGSEAVLVDFAALKADFPSAATCKIRLRAFWFATRVDGNLTIEIKTYKGGTMAQSGYDFANTGGVLVDTVTLARNAVTHDNSSSPGNDGDDMAEFLYHFATGTTAIDGAAPLVTRPAAIDKFEITQFDGRQRLLGVDAENGLVYLFAEGKTDRIRETETAIADRIVTRGYPLQSPLSTKTVKRVEVALATWHPSYTITVSTDGQNEKQIVAQDKTVDRAKYFIFGKADYDTTNANDNHEAPRREDYSVACPFKVGSGIRLPLKQERLVKFPVRMTGRFATVTIEGGQGSVDVRAVLLEGTEKRSMKEEM